MKIIVSRLEIKSFQIEDPDFKVICQNDPTVHRSYVRLKCSENMKQLLCTFTAEQWTRQYFQGEGHDIKAKGEKSKLPRSVQVPS